MCDTQLPLPSKGAVADLETRELSSNDLCKEGLAGLRVHLEQQHLIVRGCSSR